MPEEHQGQCFFTYIEQCSYSKILLIYSPALLFENAADTALGKEVALHVLPPHQLHFPSPGSVPSCAPMAMLGLDTDQSCSAVGTPWSSSPQPVSQIQTLGRLPSTGKSSQEEIGQQSLSQKGFVCNHRLS